MSSCGLTQVDVGLPGAVRRLLQGVVAPGVIRKLQNPLPQSTIRWEFVNLIEPDPLRRVKLRITPREAGGPAPGGLGGNDGGALCRGTPGHHRLAGRRDRGGSVGRIGREADFADRGETRSRKGRRYLGRDGPDAAADVLADLPRETSEELLEEMPGQGADEVRGLLAFDESTAGGMMNPQFVFVGETATREEVLQWMRSQELNLDQLDTIVLLDAEAKFSGTVSVARLLLAAPEQVMPS